MHPSGLRHIFRLPTRPSDGAPDALHRFRRKALIVLGFLVIAVFLEMNAGCLLIRQGCGPTIPIVSAIVCGGLIALLLTAIRRPHSSWPVPALAASHIAAFVCLLVLMHHMP